METKNLRVYSFRHDIVLEKEMPDFLRYLDRILSWKRIEEPRSFYQYSPAYIKTTENINGTFDKISENSDFKGKSVLTVVGSGDQIFESVLRGAKKVDGFDISMNAIMFYYLKEAALKTPSIDYHTYIRFFFTEEVDSEEYREIYAKIRPNLNPIATAYFDKVFSSSIPHAVIAQVIRRSSQYRNLEAAEEELPVLSSHLSPENFEKLREKINDCEINIYLRDVKKLDDLEGPYDYIILSNIFEYQEGPEIDEFKAAIERYREKLTPTGKILVGYAYNHAYARTRDYPDCDKVEVPTRLHAFGFKGDADRYDTLMITGRKK